MSLQRLLASLSRWSWKRARPLLAVVAVAVLASPLVLTRLRIDTDSSRLLSVNDPLARAHRSSRELFGETSPLLLLLHRGTSDTAAFDAFCLRLGEELTAWPDLRLVLLGSPWSVAHDDMEAALRRALWRSNPETVNELIRGLSEEQMRRQLLRSRKRLVAVDDPAIRRHLQRDVLGVLQELAAGRAHGMSSIELSPTSDFLESIDGNYRLVWLQPAGFGEDSAYCRELVERIEQLAQRLREELPAARGVTVEPSGVHAITAESARVLLGQMVTISVVSAALLLCLLWFAFHSLRLTVLAILPLSVAQILTLGVAAIFFNPVFAWSIGYVAIAMGLGLDVSLHLVARFVRIRAAGAGGDEEAVVATVVECGPPVTVGILSTAAAFLAILLADSPGLDQFSVLTVVGLLASLVVTLVLFPALIRVFSPKVAARPRTRIEARFFRTVGERRRWMAAFAVGVLLLSLPLAAGRRLDLGIRHLVPTGLQSVRSGERIVEVFGGSFLLTLQLMVRAPSVEEAVGAQRAVDRLLAELQGGGRIAGYRSALDELAEAVPPSPELTEAMAGLHRRLDTMCGTFLTLLAELGFSEPQSYAGYCDALLEASRPRDPLQLDALVEDPRSGLWVALRHGQAGLQSYVWPADRPGDELEMVDMAGIVAISDELRGAPVAPPAALTVTGIAEVYARVSGMVRGDMRRISAVGAGLVCLVVMLFLRDLRDGLRCLLPLLAAIPLAAAGAMLLGIPLTQTAPCLLAVIVGIGIDDAIHVVHRVRRGAAVREVLEEIGPVLSLTTASTIIGFGSLALSSLEVLSSMGLNVALGVAACWFFTVFLLPATWNGAGVRRVVVLLLAALVLCVPASTSAAEPQTADELLDELVRRAAETEAVSCEVEQVKTLRAFTAPVHLTGRVLFMQPSFLRVELAGDESFAVFSDGETLWFVDRDLDEVEVQPLVGREVIVRLLPGIAMPDLAARRDELELSLAAAAVGTRALCVAPRDPSGWPFRSVLVELDERLRIILTVVELGNGDRVTTHFSKWRRHDPVSPHAFRYHGKGD